MAPPPAPRPAASNATPVPSSSAGVPEQASPTVARQKPRKLGVAVLAAFGVGLAALLAVFVVVFRPGGSSSPETAARALQTPTAVVLPPTAALSRSTPSTETPGVLVTDLPPASATGEPAEPKPSSAAKASTKPGCATPYVIDPVTHIKHWKLDCL
jgi:hypothetical protein